MVALRKSNEELYNKYKDNPLEMLRKGVYPTSRKCFYDKCEVVFAPTSITHIYHTQACQLARERDNTFEKYGGVWEDGDKVDASGKPLDYPVLPALLEEGCIVCARCSSKLPRQNEEWWSLKKEGYVCVRCSGK